MITVSGASKHYGSHSARTANTFDPIYIYIYILCSKFNFKITYEQVTRVCIYINIYETSNSIISLHPKVNQYIATCIDTPSEKNVPSWQ